MSSIRPSTWAGTPVSMLAGGVPSVEGQYCRTRSWLPPMPPLATTTAGAVSSKSPRTERLDETPRADASSASRTPRTPVTAPPVTTSSSTRCRW
jgi:hypothetical protein